MSVVVRNVAVDEFEPSGEVLVEAFRTRGDDGAGFDERERCDVAGRVVLSAFPVAEDNVGHAAVSVPRNWVGSPVGVLVRLTEHPWLWLVVTLVSMPACFLCGRYLSHPLQWGMAALGAAALAAATSNATSSHRRQTLTVVLLSIPIELALSDGLGWYHYTFGTVPPWVPVGHGVVYFCALNLSSKLSPVSTRRLLGCVLPIACMYALVSTLTGSPDSVGVIATIMLLAVITAVKSRRGFFAVMWLLVCWLEFWGVSIGQWTWAAQMFTVLPEGNPPAGIVGVYATADLLVMGLAALSYRLVPTPELTALGTVGSTAPQG